MYPEAPLQTIKLLAPQMGNYAEALQVYKRTNPEGTMAEMLQMLTTPTDERELFLSKFKATFIHINQYAIQVTYNL